MPSRDRLLFAQMLVSPSSVTFDQPRSAAKAPFIIGAVVAAVVALVTVTAAPTTPTTTQVASVQH